MHSSKLYRQGFKRIDFDEKPAFFYPDNQAKCIWELAHKETRADCSVANHR